MADGKLSDSGVYELPETDNADLKVAKLDLNDLLTSLMTLQTDLMKGRDVMSQIKTGSESSALVTIGSVLDALRDTTSLIEIVVAKNGGPDMTAIATHFGSWMSLNWIINSTLFLIREEYNRWPKRAGGILDIAGNLKASVVTSNLAKNLDPLIEDLKTLNALLPQVVSVTFGKMSSQEIEQHIQSSYANPYWYGYQRQTRTFRDVINLLKATFASGQNEKGIMKAFAMGREAVKGAVTAAKKQNEISHNLLKLNASVELLKAMWNVPESGLGAFATKAANPFIKVSEKIFLAVPHALEQDYGFDKVEVLLLCAKKLPFATSSQVLTNWTGLRCKPPADPSSTHTGKNLIIHFHGGGFVASTPYSHEPYLRQWVNACGALMLSVNYTKAPEKQHPTAIRECFFAYKSAIEYFRPEKVVVSGDSAGGNLCLAVALMAAKEGIHVPNGILASYPATDLTKTATVSRLVFAQDIMLPYDILTLALESYVPANGDPATDYFLSPLYAPDELLKKLPDNFCFLSGTLDPLFDDCSRFLERLRAVGKSPQWFLYNLPHGFLNFAQIMPTAVKAIKDAENYLTNFFGVQK